MKVTTRQFHRPFLTALLCAAGLTLSAGPAAAQAAKAAKSKPAPKSAPAKKPGAEADITKHVAANIKFLNVLSRYADALTAAKDPATAGLAAAQIEVITKDAILAGEELAKLGRPSAELEAKIATDKELAATAARVAENTKTAVASIAANEDVKTLLAPSIGSFQAALERIQQFADEPQGKPAGAPREATAAAKPEAKSPAKK